MEAALRSGRGLTQLHPQPVQHRMAVEDLPVGLVGVLVEALRAAGGAAAASALDDADGGFEQSARRVLALHEEAERRSCRRSSSQFPKYGTAGFESR